MRGDGGTCARSLVPLAKTRHVGMTHSKGNCSDESRRFACLDRKSLDDRLYAASFVANEATATRSGVPRTIFICFQS